MPTKGRSPSARTAPRPFKKSPPHPRPFANDRGGDVWLQASTMEKQTSGAEGAGVLLVADPSGGPAAVAAASLVRVNPIFKFGARVWSVADPGRIRPSWTRSMSAALARPPPVCLRAQCALCGAGGVSGPCGPSLCLWRLVEPPSAGSFAATVRGDYLAGSVWGRLWAARVGLLVTVLYTQSTHQVQACSVMHSESVQPYPVSRSSCACAAQAY